MTTASSTSETLAMDRVSGTRQKDPIPEIEKGVGSHLVSVYICS